MLTVRAFYGIKNKYVCRGEGCMKTFCKSCPICKEKFKEEAAYDESYHKVRYHCQYTSKYRGAAHRICNLTYIVPKEI